MWLEIIVPSKKIEEPERIVFVGGNWMVNFQSDLKVKNTPSW